MKSHPLFRVRPIIRQSGISAAAVKNIAKTSVSFPASSPFVTAVGGTNIRLNGANQIIPGDTVVWNDGPGQAAAGGGGQSVLFTRPSYQNGFQTSGRRELPEDDAASDHGV